MRSVISQTWPTAGGGSVVLSVFADEPDPDAIALLEPVVAAIEGYRTALARRAPVRSCCLRRHHGPVCPDGRVMCAICFDRVDQDDLAVEDGEKVDVCRRCHAAEGGAS